MNHRPSYYSEDLTTRMYLEIIMSIVVFIVAIGICGVIADVIYEFPKYQVSVRTYVSSKELSNNDYIIVFEDSGGELKSLKTSYQVYYQVEVGMYYQMEVTYYYFRNPEISSVSKLE